MWRGSPRDWTETRHTTQANFSKTNQNKRKETKMETFSEYKNSRYETKDRLIHDGERLLKEADELAETLFEGATDKAGVPYIDHPRAVASMVRGTEEKIVALLHDVLEDVPEKYNEDMMREQFGDSITNAVKLLTHGTGLTREEYLEAIKEIAESDNITAITVKIADLRHNSDISRLGAATVDDLTESQRKRYEKYQEALEILTKASDQYWKIKYDDYIDYMMGDPAEYM